MKLFHICCNYSTTSLFKNIIETISNKEIEQIVYVPVRRREHLNLNEVKDRINVLYRFSNILRPWHRIFYKWKLRTILKDIEVARIEFDNVDIIHAHTLFSDGGVAYKLYLRYDIPYIVAVRNTDINVFFKYMLHLRKFSYEILRHASKIVFINPSYRDYLIKSIIPDKYKVEIEKKSIIVPNGIDNYWFRNIIHEKIFTNEKLRLLYVGIISRNKNLNGLLNVVDEMNFRGLPVELLIVGKDKLNKCTKLIEKRASQMGNVQVEFREMNKDVLLSYYRSADIYIMISFNETFGLTYIEALSQGLPIIFTKGEGIDGFFEPGKVGYAVRPDKPIEIVEKLSLIMKEYSSISSNCAKESIRFRWENIVENYLLIYQTIKKG